MKINYTTPNVYQSKITQFRSIKAQKRNTCPNNVSFYGISDFFRHNTPTLIYAGFITSKETKNGVYDVYLDDWRKPQLRVTKKKDDYRVATLDNKTLYKKTVQKNGTTIEEIFDLKGIKRYQIETNPKHSTSIFKKEYDKNGIIPIRSYEYAINGDLISCKGEAIEQKNNCKLEDLPEYFYHFTDYQSYRSMQRDKFCSSRTQDAILAGNGCHGIFMVDIHNFFNHWNSAQDDLTGVSLITKLARYASKNGLNKMVLLRIPTKKLDINKLTYRREELVLDKARIERNIISKKEEELYETLKYIFDYQLRKNIPCANKTRTTISNCSILREIFTPDVAKHLRANNPIEEMGQFENEALEVIYKQNIPIEDIELVGKFDVSWIENYKDTNLEAQEKIIEMIQEVV